MLRFLLIPAAFVAGLCIALADPHADSSGPLDRFAPRTAPLERIGYLAGRPDRTGLAPWVIERIGPGKPKGPGDRAKSSWHADPDALFERHARDADYVNSGYSRGHFRPAADAAASQREMDATHDLLNIGPQNQPFNAGSWEKLEEYGRDLAAAGNTVTIITLPIFKPAAHHHRHDGSESWSLVLHAIGPDQLWVPSHFAKSLLIEGKGNRRIESFLAANSDLSAKQSIDAWRIATDELEAIAGLDLWPGVKDEDELEKQTHRAGD